MAQVILLPGQPVREPENEEVKRIKEKLLSLPGQIAEQKHLAREQKIAADEIRGQIQEIEAEILYQINTATNNAGKPLYGNEALRNAELKRRLAANPEHRRLKSALAEIESRQFEYETLASQLMSEFSAWKAVAEITAAEIMAGL